MAPGQRRARNLDRPADTQSAQRTEGSKTIDELLNETPTRTGAGRSQTIDELLNETGTIAGTAGLPETPSRGDVVLAMAAVKPEVEACGGESGVAFAEITVAGDTGRVTNAQISGQTGSVGSCIARAVRRAEFPRFRSATFRVRFPFKLIGGAPAEPVAAAAGDSDLPEAPTRDDVVRAMQGVKSAVQACAAGTTGVATADLTVSGSTGRVSRVTVTGIEGGVGSCIAKAVRLAEFPRFKETAFNVRFPFRF